jgi:hypothetical protein
MRAWQNSGEMVCVFFNLLVYQWPYFYNWSNNIIYLMWQLWDLNKIMILKYSNYNNYNTMNLDILINVYGYKYYL